MATRWGNWHPRKFRGGVEGMQNGTIALKISGVGPENVKQNTTTPQQCRSQAHTPESGKHRSAQTLVHNCSLRHYSKWPPTGNNPNAYQLMNG